MDSINFTANYIKPVRIRKLNKENKYSTYSASLVELDYNNEHDINAVAKTVEEWDDPLTSFTLSDMKKATYQKDRMEPFRVFAITTQKSNFEKMHPDKILGIAEVTEKNANREFNKLEVLQTNTDYNYDIRYNCKTKYKDIGKKLLNYLQNKYETLYTYSVNSARNFYIKMGFKKDPDMKRSNDLIYRK